MSDPILSRVTRRIGLNRSGVDLLKVYIDERLEAMRSELAQIAAVQAQRIEEAEQSLRTVVQDAFSHAASARAWDREQLDAIGSQVTRIEFDSRDGLAALRHDLTQAIERVQHVFISEIVSRLEVAASARAWDREQLDAIGSQVTRIEFDSRDAAATLRMEMLQAINEVKQSLTSDIVARLDAVASARDWDREQLDAIGSQVTRIEYDQREGHESLRSELERVQAELLKVGQPSGPKRRPNLVFPARGLFIVGHARTGTSVLLDALNQSEQIFVFFEANFHFSGETVGFCDWYNDMHASFEHPPSKSTFCPPMLPETATGFDYLAALGE